jgi:hypothetical protein
VRANNTPLGSCAQTLCKESKHRKSARALSIRKKTEKNRGKGQNENSLVDISDCDGVAYESDCASSDGCDFWKI